MKRLLMFLVSLTLFSSPVAFGHADIGKCPAPNQLIKALSVKPPMKGIKPPMKVKKNGNSYKAQYLVKIPIKNNAKKVYYKKLVISVMGKKYSKKDVNQRIKTMPQLLPMHCKEGGYACGKEDHDGVYILSSTKKCTIINSH